jgi:hypothetical protein
MVNPDGSTVAAGGVVEATLTSSGTVAHAVDADPASAPPTSYRGGRGYFCGPASLSGFSNATAVLACAETVGSPATVSATLQLTTPVTGVVITTCQISGLRVTATGGRIGIDAYVAVAVGCVDVNGTSAVSIDLGPGLGSAPGDTLSPIVVPYRGLERCPALTVTARSYVNTISVDFAVENCFGELAVPAAGPASVPARGDPVTSSLFSWIPDWGFGLLVGGLCAVVFVAVCSVLACLALRHHKARYAKVPAEPP